MDAKTAVEIIRDCGIGKQTNADECYNFTEEIADLIERQAVLIKEQNKIIVKYNNDYEPACEYIKQCNEVIEKCKHEAKYAELGQLAIKIIKDNYCCGVLNGNNCQLYKSIAKTCIAESFCQKRAELLKGDKNG